MASLKGQCQMICKENQSYCWHQDCIIRKRFTSGQFLIENKYGHVRAAVPYDLMFSNAEKDTYKQYNLEADEWVLEAEIERTIFRQTVTHTLQKYFM